MRYRINHTLLIFFIFSGGILCAQQHTIDSLLGVIKQDRPDTNKVLHICALSEQYSLLGEYTKGIGSAQEALSLARQLGYSKGITFSSLWLGNSLIYQGNYIEALQVLLASLKIQEKTSDKKGAASTHISIGGVYYYEGKYKEALGHYSASLALYLEIHDKKGIAYAYVGLGNMYSVQGKDEEALYNYREALKIKKEAGKEDEAVAIIYMNIGSIYANRENYTEALSNNLAALGIREKNENKGGVAVSMLNIGQIYLHVRKLSEAENYLKKSLEVSLEIGNKEWIKNGYLNLTFLDSLKGDFKAAFAHHKLFISYRDSLNNSEVERKSTQLAMQYEFEKKEMTAKLAQEKRDALSEKEKQRQQIILYSTSFVLIIVIISASLLYKRYRLTARQKQIIEEKSREVEEKQKEIIDSITYARRIQRALITNEKYIDKELKRLGKNS